MNTIKIREYSALRMGEQNGLTVNGYTTLSEDTFNALERFVLDCKKDSDDALEIMGISAKRGIGKVITAKNYVGIITMKDGTTIEILPKLYLSGEDEDSGEYERFAKSILVKMLRTLYKMPHVTLQPGNMDIAKMPLLEMFIRMFVDEVSKIVKQGIRSNYETVEENSMFFKGKVKFSEHLKRNHIHRERSYVVYDAFTVNRPENRIIKTTLEYLYLHTGSSGNKKDIKYLLNMFDGVASSIDHSADFAKIVPDRNTKGYSSVLAWARIFLSGKSFTSFSGSEAALALLFPMDRLFESYIASVVRRKLGHTDYSVTSQHRGYYLFDEPRRAFRIRPDIVVTHKIDKSVYVLDTKWKILDENKANNNISQGDMYQMYVYQKKYNAENVTLLYPLSRAVSPTRDVITYRAENGSVTVRACFVDMKDAESSIKDILGKILNKPTEETENIL